MPSRPRNLRKRKRTSKEAPEVIVISSDDEDTNNNNANATQAELDQLKTDYAESMHLLNKELSHVNAENVRLKRAVGKKNAEISELTQQRNVK
ncbi:hypothetical protein EIP86_000123 [Pleurotus ostreatoroseus]|nr:hypothetical protein EIP86_000123 [Pleurotus ostreatoroseus]